MKRIYLLLIMIVAALTTSAQWWSWQNPLPTACDLCSVHFPDENTGYAVGVMGTIIKTKDAALTWSVSPRITDKKLSSVFFSTVSRGCAVGEEGTILKTTDGGLSWNEVTKQTLNDLNSVYFVDHDNGYAVGASGTILKTSDGGSTWSFLFTAGTDENLMSVYFLDALYGFTVGKYGTILKTIDGGTSWTTLISGTTSSLNTVYFTDANIGYIGTSTGQILKTSNAGQSWYSVNVANVSFSSLQFTDENTGYAAGLHSGDYTNGYNNTFIVYKTTNGGAIWTKVCEANAGDDEDFLVSPKFYLNFISSNTGYLVGDYGQLFKTIDGGSTWSNQQKFVTSESLNRTTFLDENTGFIIGNSGTILQTSNAGVSWNSLSSSSNSNLKDICFINANKGFIVGENGTLLKTLDGGATWNPVSLGITSNLSRIWFTHDNVGFITGDAYLKSTDGGSTWNLLSSGTGIFTSIYDIYFTDANTGYAAGSYNYIYKTTDGGATWYLVQSNSGSGVFSYIYFMNPDTGFVLGPGGASVRTTNGGSTWMNLGFGYHDGMKSMSYLPGTKCLYLFANTSDGGSYSYCSIFESKDFGVTWVDITPEQQSMYCFNSLAFPNPNDGYYVGGNGTILKTMKTAPLSIKNNFETEVSKFNVSPNPAQDRIFLTTSNHSREKVTVSIYNTSGKMIKQELVQITDFVEINLNDIPKGVYFLKISTISSVESKKLILN